MPSSSTDQHPDHDRSQPLFTLAVLGTQAAPPLFYPYLRRYFGQRFWSLKRLAFLTAICFGAILMRVYFRSLTFIVVERLPANPHRWSPAYESDNWVGERFILSFLVFWFAATALAIGHRILAWRRSSQAGFPYIESQHPGYSRLWFLVRLPALQRLGFLQSYNGAEAFLEPPFLFVVGYARSFVLPEFGAFVVLGSLLLFWNEFSVWRAYHHRDLDAKDAVVSGLEHELRMREALGQIEQDMAEEKPLARPSPPPPNAPRQVPASKSELSPAHRAMLDPPEH